ncbi:MAG: MFS transporter [Coriobacteriia bacterium]|nr:MFS transporter [Coriobacteriia bacterium]
MPEHTGNDPAAAPTEGDLESPTSSSVAENPDDFASQDPLTIEVDTEVPPAALVRQGWVANTFHSFTHRDFSLFWAGALVSNIGSWMQNAALVIVVYGLAPEQASLYAGLVGFISGAPVFFLAIPAGDIADRFDRRKLLMVIQVVLLAQAIALGVLYDSGILTPERPILSLALVSALGLIAGVFSAFMMPAFQSMLPDLVPRKSLMNAIALNAVQFQSSRMFGPMIVSAMVLAGAGMGLVFYANAASFIFVILALAAIRSRAEFSPQTDPKRRTDETVMQRVGAGIVYARQNRAVGMLIISTSMLTIFGFPYMTLLAAIVAENLGGSVEQVSRAVAAIMAFNGLGALLGALGVASLPDTTPRNRVIPYTLFAFALFVSLFSQMHVEWTMAVFSVLAGAALMATNSLAMTSIQSSVPGYLRGRVMALFVMSFVGIMPFSALVFGPVGQAIGPDRAVLLAGVVLLAWAVVLALRPNWLEPGPTENPSAA